MEKKHIVLPKRVFNSPLVEYRNFEDGSHLNLIRLIKPYANGYSWAIHDTTKNSLCSSRMFTSYTKSKMSFDLMVEEVEKELRVLGGGLTGN